MPADVGWAGLGLSLVLVVVAVAVSRWRRLGLEATITWAAARAIGQLLVVGAALGLVLDPGRPLVWSWLWVVAMFGVAADVVRRRAPEVPGLLLLAGAGFAASAAVTLGVIFGLGVFPLEGRTLVPLAGLTVGNTMNATVLVARRVVEELRDKRAEVEARLALGQPAPLAARPYLAAALRTALIPQIERTKAVGLVALPGAMTGLILAGVDPLDAVVVQAVVMFLVLGAVATTTTVVGLGAARRLFTSDHRLVALVRPAGG
ncbi:MAG: ABC transporter permease [Acidimicrobiales bacterium]